MPWTVLRKYPPSVFFNLHRLVWSVQSRPHLVRIYWFFNEQLERDHPATFNNFPSSKSKNKKKTEELAEVPFLIIFLHQVVPRNNVLPAEEFQYVMQIWLVCSVTP